MSYEIDFTSRVDRVIGRSDVQSVLADPDVKVDEDFLRSSLVENEAECVSLAAPALQKYEDIEREISRIDAEHDKMRRPSGMAGWAETVAGFWILILLVGGVGWFFGWGLPADALRETFAWSGWTWKKVSLGGFMVFTAAVVTARIAWQIHLRMINRLIRNDTRLSARRSELGQAGEEIDRQLDELAAAAAFEVLGAGAEPFFQGRLVQIGTAAAQKSRLKLTSPTGLSEVAAKSHEVPTVVRRDLVGLLSGLPGASIGLSGPRGSGKSTILRSLTAGTLPLRGKRAVAVYTAAPVEYDARDFLLHLFASLCRKVLRAHDTEEHAHPDIAHAGIDESWPDRIVRLSVPLMLLGLIMLFTGTAIGWAIWSLQPEASTTGRAQQSFFTALDLKPGPLILFGIVCFLIGYASLFLRMMRRSRDDSDSLLERLYPWLKRPGSDIADEPDLVRRTRHELREIRFQRSFTSGWSGALKIPAGFELGRSGSAALSQRQETLPELVDRFCKYVEAVSAEHGAVLIAVDELDKLKSAQQAEDFINSVKSIFAIPNCFYLVSVSEDALSAFERRGLSLRDAFDSAFDDIRYIGYADLEGSRQLLRRRIINMPDPFLCLCHILSGGLPRDLIRIARTMFQILVRLPGGMGDLSTIAARLVEREKTAKIRATRTAMRSIAIEPEVGAFAAALAELEEEPTKSPRFARALTNVVAQPREDADADALANLISIQRELEAYLQFLRLVLRLSQTLSTRAGWQEGVAKHVEPLARARQALETSVSVASARFEKLRVALGSA